MSCGVIFVASDSLLPNSLSNWCISGKKILARFHHYFGEEVINWEETMPSPMGLSVPIEIGTQPDSGMAKSGPESDILDLGGNMT